MNISPEQVLVDLKQKKYAPVYFLHGDESFYIDQISSYIEENVLNETEKSFNQTIMYGRDSSVSAVLNNARRFPMMAERQVVIVKEAQNISDLNREDGSKLLMDYLNNPVPSTVLVFCHKNKSLDKRKALGKAIDKLAVSVATKKMYDNQLPSWIENYIKSKAIGATPKAIQMLADAIGNDLERLANEIDKVIINLKDKSLIDEDIVQKYVGISKDYNVFELQKALIIKDINKANRIVNYFDANSKKNPIIPILAILFSFYSKLLMAMHSKDRSPQGLAATLKMNSYFVQDYATALNKYSLVQVINNIHQIRVADLKSKGVESSGSTTDGQLLRELVFKLLH